MTGDISSSPKRSKKNNKSVWGTFFTWMLDVFASAGVIPLLLIAGIAVGTLLELTSNQETKQLKGSSLDQAIVEGVRAAVPTVPTETGQACLCMQSSTASAYLVAVANLDGVRVKTIVTR
jgi:hypothetical protein